MRLNWKMAGIVTVTYDPDLSLTHFFLTSFICEEVGSISIRTEIPKFATCESLLKPSSLYKTFLRI